MKQPYKNQGLIVKSVDMTAIWLHEPDILIFEYINEKVRNGRDAFFHYLDNETTPTFFIDAKELSKDLKISMKSLFDSIVNKQMTYKLNQVNDRPPFKTMKIMFEVGNKKCTWSIDKLDEIKSN